MKKSLLLFCLLIGVHYVFANTSQGKWRWRKDDGSETTATWLAAENTAPTVATYEQIRVRIEQFNSSGSDTYDISNLNAQYSLTGADNSWTDINTDSNTHDFVLATSTLVADGTPTTEQLSTRVGYTFVAGRVISSTAAFSYTLAPARKTEFEFVFKPTASAKLSTTYFFRCSKGDNSNPLPTLTTASTLPVNLVSFGVTNNGGKALVKWTTGSEINNDHFEVLRSQNGQSWQSVANVQAKGSGQNSYSFTDNTPLSGNSYYRLKQVDKDGKTALSEVKNFSLKNLINAVASIYPNPTTAGINVMLNSYTGTVTATVTNTQGAVVLRQIIAATASTSSYKLNVSQKLASGTYYVNLSGTDLSQKLKVIVQ